MNDKRITGDHDAVRPGRPERVEALPRDERLDRLVTALAEARPVLDDVTRARVAAKLAAVTRKLAVGSGTAGGPPPSLSSSPSPLAAPRRSSWHRRRHTRMIVIAVIVVALAVLAAALALR